MSTNWDELLEPMRHVMVGAQLDGLEYVTVEGGTALTFRLTCVLPFPIEDHAAIVEELLANRHAMVLSWKKGEPT